MTLDELVEKYGHVQIEIQPIDAARICSKITKEAINLAREYQKELRDRAIIACIGGWLCHLCRTSWDSQPPDGYRFRGEKHNDTCLLRGTTDSVSTPHPDVEPENDVTECGMCDQHLAKDAPLLTWGTTRYCSLDCVRGAQDMHGSDGDDRNADHNEAEIERVQRSSNACIACGRSESEHPRAACPIYQRTSEAPPVESHEAFAARIRSFSRSDGLDGMGSTLRCYCGEIFTWCGADERLRPWVDAHHPHLAPRTNEPRGLGKCANCTKTNTHRAEICVPCFDETLRQLYNEGVERIAQAIEAEMAASEREQHYLYAKRAVEIVRSFTDVSSAGEARSYVSVSTYVASRVEAMTARPAMWGGVEAVEPLLMLLLEFEALTRYGQTIRVQDIWVRALRQFRGESFSVGLAATHADLERFGPAAKAVYAIARGLLMATGEPT